jgi:hypothetical protein
MPAPTGLDVMAPEPEYPMRDRSITGSHGGEWLYSAFAPGPYVRLINELPDFPERHVMVALREIGVKVTSGASPRYFQAEDFDRLMQKRSKPHPGAAMFALFGDGTEAMVVVLETELRPSE